MNNNRDRFIILPRVLKMTNVGEYASRVLNFGREMNLEVKKKRAEKRA